MIGRQRGGVFLASCIGGEELELYGNSVPEMAG